MRVIGMEIGFYYADVNYLTVLDQDLETGRITQNAITMRKC